MHSNIQSFVSISPFLRYSLSSVHYTLRNPVYGVAYNPNGEFLASGTIGGSLNIWSLRVRHASLCFYYPMLMMMCFYS